MSTQTFVLIELVLVFGGILLFGWHQIRSVRTPDTPPEEPETSSDPAAEARKD